MRYVFADCVLDTQRCVLTRDGRVIALRPKVFRVLWYLLTQPARVVPSAKSPPRSGRTRSPAMR